MKVLFFVIVAMVAIIWSGCYKITNPVTAEPLVGIIVPLNVGNSWTYSISAFDSLGTLIRTWDSTFAISGDTVIDQRRWFLFANEQWDGTGKGPMYAMTDSGFISDWPGLRLIYKPGIDLTYKTTEFDSALYDQTGIPTTRYVHPVDVFLGRDLDQIIVPTGSFVCYRYNFFRSSSSFNFSPDHLDYVAPGVGVIKKVVYTHQQPRDFPFAKVVRTEVYELKSYNLL